MDRRLARLLDAIETGGEVGSLVSRVRELEERRRDLRAEAAALRPVPRLAPAVIESRLAEWRRLLRQSTTQGRAVLQRVLRGRIKFMPREGAEAEIAGEGYNFSADTRFDRLFTGVVVETPSWAQG